MKNILLVTIIFLSTNTLAEMWLGEWLEINEPKFINYLKTLNDSNKGNKIDGVVLSDSSNPLKGHIFINHKFINNTKTNIYVFQNSDKTLVAYLWVAKNGTKFPLPPCMGNDPRIKWPGWSGAGLSGDVYTYPDVQPGIGIVSTHCVPEIWLN